MSNLPLPGRLLWEPGVEFLPERVWVNMSRFLSMIFQYFWIFYSQMHFQWLNTINLVEYTVFRENSIKIPETNNALKVYGNMRDISDLRLTLKALGGNKYYICLPFCWSWCWGWDILLKRGGSRMRKHWFWKGVVLLHLLDICIWGLRKFDPEPVCFFYGKKD